MFIEKLLYFIYPPKCGICGKINKNYICNNCYKNMYVKFKGQCQKIVGVGFHPDPCINSYKNRYFNKHIYLFKYNGIIREKIIEYKFRDKAYLKDFFTQIIIKNKKICRFFKNYDIIIPIPIHKKRLRQRGYNQTELLAREIVKKLELKTLKNALIKYKNTKPQSELNKQERMENVIGVYKVINNEQIFNKKILLIDDVYTTGSTTNECAKVLKEAGASIIDIFTIAKD